MQLASHMCQWGGPVDTTAFTRGCPRPLAHPNLLQAYDPASFVWQPLPDMLHPRYAHALVAQGGYLYALGGQASKAIHRCRPLLIYQHPPALVDPVHTGANDICCRTTVPHIQMPCSTVYMGVWCVRCIPWCSSSRLSRCWQVVYSCVCMWALWMPVLAQVCGGV